MKNRGLFPVKEFARLSRTSRDTLHHYDKIGLLTPLLRGKNGYRYYSCEQLAFVNVIRTLQQLGMSLAEIKNYKDHRTPENVDEILTYQIKKINGEIDNWMRSKKLLLLHQKSIRSVADIDESSISVQNLPAEPIILGGLNDYSGGKDDYAALVHFYYTISKKYPDLDLNYPVWGFFSEERVRQGDWAWPERYYFFNPSGHDARPAGRYAVGYMRGGYNSSAELFLRMLGYIADNGLEICGNAYKEYPLNEVSISDDKNYLIRIMIAVREKTD